MGLECENNMKNTNRVCGKRQSEFICKRNGTSTCICNCSEHRLRTSHTVSKYAEIIVLSVVRLRVVEKWILSVLFVQLKLCWHN